MKLKGNLVQGVNIWGVSFLRYLAACIGWRKCELLAVDRKTRNLFMIYRGLHPKSDLDRLYIPRNDRGRDLIAIEDCIELPVKGLEVYVHGTEEWLLQAARGNRSKEWASEVVEVVFGFRMEVRRERETSMIIAAQNQSIRTNLVKAKIDKSQKDMLWRL